MKSLVAAVLACLSLAASAQTAADRVVVSNPVVRLAPPTSPVSGAFMRIRNSSAQEVTLNKVESTVANTTELHNHINEGGVMKMRAVSALTLKAGDELELKPGGYHIMLIDLKSPLKEGDTVVVTLGFADGSRKAVAAKVVKNVDAGAAHSH